MNEMNKAAPLPEAGFVRASELANNPKAKRMGIIPVSPATLWRWVSARTFPQPVKLSQGVTAWPVEAVRSWIDAHQ